MTLSRRRLLSLSAVAALQGCGALDAVSRSTDPLDLYTLSPLAPDGRTGGRGHLVVELPTSGGELATDRILIKTSALQAEYLPDGRWSEPIPALVQTLLVASLLNRGAAALVGRVGAGLSPDHTLMTEILAFQAEASGAAPGALQVRVAMQMTLIRESDRAIAGTRRFAATGAAPSDGTPALVAGLDAAMGAVLDQVAAWVAATI